MNRHTRRTFEAFGRRLGDLPTFQRFQIVAMLASGNHTRTQVARLLNRAVSNVVDVVNRYVAHGVLGLLDGRTTNGQVKVDEAFLKHLESLLKRDAPEFGWSRPTWTRETLLLQMEQDGFAKVSPATIGRALAALGAKRKVPKLTIRPAPPPQERLRVVRKLLKLAAASSPESPVYWSDEVDINLNPKVGPDWMLPGQRKTLPTPGNNQKRYIAGALSAEKTELIYAQGDRRDSVLFCKLLKRLVGMNPKATCIHVIVDNGKMHTSKFTQKFIAGLPVPVQLHFLPPYCPDDNPIEREWLDLHNNVTRNHKHESMDALMAAVRYFLATTAHRRAGGISPSQLRQPPAHVNSMLEFLES